MNTHYYLYKKSPEYPAVNNKTVLYKVADTMVDCLYTAMSDIYAEIHKRGGEKGGQSSLWRCAKEIYDSLDSGKHYFYTDIEWWIEKAPLIEVERTWVFRFSAVFDTSFCVEAKGYKDAKEKSKEIVKQSAADLKEYVGKDLLGWQYDGNWADEGEEEITQTLLG